MTRCPPRRLSPAWLRRVGAILLAVLVAAPLPAVDDGITTAVYSQVEKGYKRKKAADGSFQREFYALSHGGQIPGTIKDAQQDKVQVAALAGVVAEFLARQQYFPAAKQDEADLLIVFHWGTTIPFSDGTYRAGMDRVHEAANQVGVFNRMERTFEPPVAREGEAPETPGVNISASAEDMERQAAIDGLNTAMITQDMFNKMREQANEKNARLLGYLREINQSNGIQRWAGGGTLYADLVNEIEEPRYYVIISAYDFRQTVKEKKPTLRWVTRVSIRSPGNSFEDRIRTMLANASKYFGRDTDRLVRQYERRGTVEIGESTVVGYMSDPAPRAESKADDGKKAEPERK